MPAHLLLDAGLIYTFGCSVEPSYC